MTAGTRRRPTSFPHFALLPAELRLKVWEASCQGPSMHLFDVCSPTSRYGNSRSVQAFCKPIANQTVGQTGSVDDLPETARARFDRYKDKVFLDAVDTSDAELARPTGVARHRVDPSVYMLVDRIRGSCVDAARVVTTQGPSKQAAISTVTRSIAADYPCTPEKDTAPEQQQRQWPDDSAVYLPGPDRWVPISNARGDVLGLRFRNSSRASRVSARILLGELEAHAADVASEAEAARLLESLGGGGISESLVGTWSDEMAAALRCARRVALDVAEIWSCSADDATMTGNSDAEVLAQAMDELLFEETVYLACVLQSGLEVLYLIDNCVGRCPRCMGAGGGRARRASQLQAKGLLWKALQGGADGEVEQRELQRHPDVIQGVRKIYKEVFDFEALGWHEKHPTFVYAKTIGDAIRSQQAGGVTATFQGVRVLIVEDEDIGDVDASMVVDCSMRHEWARDTRGSSELEES